MHFVTSMDLLATLGRTLGFSLAAGVNLYATVAILGLATKYGWVVLPDQFQAFNNDYVIIAAIVMYAIEFFADKIPYFDSLWDAIHTAIRPVGGAVIAVTTLGDASPGMKAVAALLGGRRGQQPSDEDEHSCSGQHESGAVFELDPEPGGRRLRGWSRLHGPRASRCCAGDCSRRTHPHRRVCGRHRPVGSQMVRATTCGAGESLGGWAR